MCEPKSLDRLSEGTLLLKNNIVLFANKSAKDILGDISSGANFTDFFDPDLAAKILSLENGVSQEYEFSADDKTYLLNVSKMMDLSIIAITNAFSMEAIFDSRIPELYHELNMPLTIIFSTLSLLSKRLKSNEDDKIDQYLSIINNNCYRLMRLSGNVMNISRFVSSHEQFFPMPIHLQPFLRRVVDSVAPYSLSFGIPITFEDLSDPIWLNIDAELIERLLLNLLSNSIKFTKPENVITMRLRSDPENVYISVTDKGVGLSPESLEKAFKCGIQPENPGHPGHGMGLMIVNMIASLHNGTMSAESELGSGTTMTLTLPNKKADSSTLSAFRTPYSSHGGFKQALIEFSDIFSSDPIGHYLP